MTNKELEICAKAQIPVRGTTYSGGCYIGVPVFCGRINWRIDGMTFHARNIVPWEEAEEDAAHSYAIRRLYTSAIWQGPSEEIQPPVSILFVIEELKAAFNAGMVKAGGISGEVAQPREGLKGEAALRYVAEKFEGKAKEGGKVRPFFTCEEREISRPNAYGGVDDVPVIDDPLGSGEENDDA